MSSTNFSPLISLLASTVHKYQSVKHNDSVEPLICCLYVEGEKDIAVKYFTYTIAALLCTQYDSGRLALNDSQNQAEVLICHTLLGVV